VIRKGAERIHGGSPHRRGGEKGGGKRGRVGPQGKKGGELTEEGGVPKNIEA